MHLGHLQTTGQMIHYVNKEGRMDNYISDVETLLHRLKDSDISSGTCKSDGAKKSNLSSRSYVQTVIDSIDDPTVILDRDYRVLFMNKRMKETSAWADFSKPVLFCYEVFQDSTKPCCGKSRPCPLSSVVKTRAPVATRHSYHDGLYNKKFTDVVATPVFDEAVSLITASLKHHCVKVRCFTGPCLISRVMPF
jgi:hypothetical protein